MKYENLLVEKEKLENILKSKASTDEHQELLQLKYKTYELEQKNKELKQKLHISTDDQQQTSAGKAQSKVVDKSFGEQIPVSHDHYKIPIAIRNKKMVGALDDGTGGPKSLPQFQIVEESQNVLQQPMQINGKSSTTTTTTPTSVIKKENLVSPVGKVVQPTSAKTVVRSKPLPKGKFF